MKSRWSRACTWAGLTEMYAGPALLPMPWKMAARAWIVIYLGSTFVMTSALVVVDALTGVPWSSQSLAPLAGAMTYMLVLGGGYRVARLLGTADRQRIRAGRWAVIVAWISLLVMAFIVDTFLHPTAGWARFGTSVVIGTAACIVFVAVTHVRPNRTRTT